MSVFALSIRMLCLCVGLNALPNQIPLAAVFDINQDSKHELAFKYGVERINRDPSILPGKRLKAEIVRVPEGNSFAAERETCRLLQQGVAAIFGPQSHASADHIKSIIDSVEIPFIDTRWNYRPSARNFLGQKTSEQYTVNLHPDVETLGRAYIDLIVKYGWETITILYENNDSMMRLKGIFDRTSDVPYGSNFRIVTKELKMTENGYRDVLREVYASKATNIILDCSKTIISEVLKQAQQVGLVSEEYYYLITTLDAHTVDLEDFKYGGTNFTAFRLIDTGRPDVQNVIRSIVQNEMNQGRIFNFQDGNLDTDTALIYDSVQLFAQALHELNQIQVTKHLRVQNQSTYLRVLAGCRHRPRRVRRSTLLASRLFVDQLHEIGRIRRFERQGCLRHTRPSHSIPTERHGVAIERTRAHRHLERHRLVELNQGRRRVRNRQPDQHYG